MPDCFVRSGILELMVMVVNLVFDNHPFTYAGKMANIMLAAPCSMLIMRLFFSPTRSFWQELAWLLSAVFWCALGALCFLFISSLFKPQHRKNQ